MGRQAELRALDDLLASVAGGEGGAIVLRGVAGIGKSALLERATDRAVQLGMRVLSTAGVQAEVHVPYAGLHRLLRAAPELSRTADGVLQAPDASPYRAAVVMLDLFSDRAADTALLLTVEDAHWLDAASWDALTFVARRLSSDRIAMVFTVRDGDDVDRRLGSAGLPEVRLEPLSADDSADLLAEVAPGLSPALGQRVLDEAAGNPLGLVELGGAAMRSGAGALLPSSLPLSTRVERTFSGLVSELPPATRSLLLVAALDDGDDLDEIVGACRRIEGDGVSADDIEPAVMTRLVQVDDRFRVRFRHPLLRSALYQSVPPTQRRRVHAALADTLSRAPDRRIWHRAAAASGPDEHLAKELTDAARRAYHRQTIGTALAAFEQAVRLSEETSARGHRLVSAIEAAVAQGDAETTVRLLKEVREDELAPADRALYGLIREVFQGTGWGGPERIAAFVDAAETMARDGDADAALESLAAAAVRVYWSVLEPEVTARLVAVAESLDAPADDPRLVYVLGYISPMTHGAWCLRRMVELRERGDLSPHHELTFGFAAWGLGAHTLCVAILKAVVVRLRDQGRLGMLSKALITHVSAAAYLGDVRTALAIAVEGDLLAAETGEDSWRLSLAMARGFAEALRGETATALQIADRAEAVLVPARQLTMLSLVQQIRGVAALADGRPEDAYRELHRVFDPTDQAYHPYTRFSLLGHLADAAVRCGALAPLRQLVEEMTSVAAQCPSPALLAGLRYARTVLAGTAEAYEAALADDFAGWSFEQARLQHAYGTWLRRHRRAADCRPMLRAAVATFDALGATAWGDRARSELRASGETLRRPTVDATQNLTPQETQIATLAAEGLSNRDIAARLFLSPRTVTTHLTRIYPKLGIRSRGELSRILGTPA